MNFLLMRSNQAAAPAELPPAHKIQTEAGYAPKPGSTLGALFAEDPLLPTKSFEGHDGESDGHGNGGGFFAASVGKGSHIEVSESEGWIAIPKEELPDNWSEALDMTSLRSLDRSFVFPGEQVQVVACLAAFKQDTEIITPFKVAELMNKNGFGENNDKEGCCDSSHSQNVSGAKEINDSEDFDKTNRKKMQGNSEPENEVSAGASLLRMEEYKRQTESLVQRFKNSHFFARIAGSDEALWTKRKAVDDSSGIEERFMGNSSDTKNNSKKKLPSNAAIDRGNFDGVTSGGVARNATKCCALPNGDIGVLLQINVGAEFVRDPVLEILQFEKYQDISFPSVGHEDSVSRNQDPCGELLKWLFPLENSIPPPTRSLTPPQFTSVASIRSTSTRVALSGSTGSQLFSFGNFRSYSMSSLPPNILPPSSTSTPNCGPGFEPDDWERFSFRKAIKSENSGSGGLLSYRGVSLEPERFSVHCGLEGIHIPGRKWRRKIEIIQPLEITSFAAYCSIDDLISVQIKNVAPEHAPDVVVYLDSISIVFEEASESGRPLSLPTACIEAGNDHCLPNLALRMQVFACCNSYLPYYALHSCHTTYRQQAVIQAAVTLPLVGQVPHGTLSGRGYRPHGTKVSSHSTKVPSHSTWVPTGAHVALARYTCHGSRYRLGGRAYRPPGTGVSVGDRPERGWNVGSGGTLVPSRRSGEEHSFILKPATSTGTNSKVCSERSSQSRISAGNVASTRKYSLNAKARNSVSPADHYAILVSCRCNYIGSKLFFKQQTSWRPRISRDLMISVASEMSKQTLESNDRVAQLPAQVLTLQASNLTSEDLTMTVLAPASLTSPPSVMSLSSPTSPASPFFGSRFSEKLDARQDASRKSDSSALVSKVLDASKGHKRAVSFDERVISIPDVHPSRDSGCTHLWLQSRVPLGCVPSQSTATVKLEVLPLTDGIITLDSLQIEVTEKGITYIPEHSLKIYATSSIPTGTR
ncbi:hypothetical protein DM860_008208 [Cuscuta australis]|uniref:Uncharacterized protein n=1 Tax=Cuscuta australis TaxID=267555 RepID=A0A328D6I4_9ASTE|nr:hypothetical protein DM860_008208 [Cuscuta australis]